MKIDVIDNESGESYWRYESDVIPQIGHTITFIKARERYLVRGIEHIVKPLDHLEKNPKTELINAYVAQLPYVT
jgi:hypothetical protein